VNRTSSTFRPNFQDIRNAGGLSHPPAHGDAEVGLLLEHLVEEGALCLDAVPNSIAEPDVRGSHLKLQVQLTLLHCVIENLAGYREFRRKDVETLVNYVQGGFL